MVDQGVSRPARYSGRGPSQGCKARGAPSTRIRGRQPIQSTPVTRSKRPADLTISISMPAHDAIWFLSLGIVAHGFCSSILLPADFAIWFSRPAGFAVSILMPAQLVIWILSLGIVAHGFCSSILLPADFAIWFSRPADFALSRTMPANVDCPFAGMNFLARHHDCRRHTIRNASSSSTRFASTSTRLTVPVVTTSSGESQLFGA